MNHDLKIMCLQGISLGIFGMMGSIIVMLIVEAVRRYKEGDHAELDLFDAMGKFIYFINDADIERETLIGIRIEDDWNKYIAFFHEVPGGHKKKFIILTSSCWEFDLDAFGKEWFLTEDEAKAFKKAKKSANR